MKKIITLSKGGTNDGMGGKVKITLDGKRKKDIINRPLTMEDRTMYHDVINLTFEAVEGLEKLFHQDFNRVETPERMAWIILVLKRMPDNKEYFPKGKWATIQHIEMQLDMAAEKEVKQLLGEI